MASKVDGEGEKKEIKPFAVPIAEAFCGLNLHYLFIG